MPSLKATECEQNLKGTLAGVRRANRRYDCFTQTAAIEKFSDVAAVFRSIAAGNIGYEFDPLEYPAEAGDPAAGIPIGSIADNRKAVIAARLTEYTDMHLGVAGAAHRKVACRSLS
ncbi:hypothetical protein GCM10010909_35040 [Acidocella aquatica]|uniref:Uncharacterized protein n=1 Tax=Acidocella aquatica TaxID=1922313 RepID=A0ABQ6AAN0_9PROT|nr:rubrerythrin [Acidocella aquatica]GLR68822.1 hypothetical protein GCM10010909_35040 [Acidocella aquatica]